MEGIHCTVASYSTELVSLYEKVHQYFRYISTPLPFCHTPKIHLENVNIQHLKVVKYRRVQSFFVKYSYGYTDFPDILC